MGSRQMNGTIQKGNNNKAGEERRKHISWALDGWGTGRTESPPSVATAGVPQGQHFCAVRDLAQGDPYVHMQLCQAGLSLSPSITFPLQKEQHLPAASGGLTHLKASSSQHKLNSLTAGSTKTACSQLQNYIPPTWLQES